MISLEVLTKLMLNSETNLTCITVTSQCNQYVATVINHWHPNHGLGLVNDMHTHRSLWICYMSHEHVHKAMEHVCTIVARHPVMSRSDIMSGNCHCIQIHFMIYGCKTG